MTTREEVKQRREYHRELYKQYVPRKKIAEMTGYSYEVVWKDTEGIEISKILKKHRKRISNEITSALEDLGRNQTWLSEELGVTRAAVSTYTTGKIIPPEEVRRNICRILKIPKNSLEMILE